MVTTRVLKATCKLCDKPIVNQEAVVIRVLRDGRQRYAHIDCAQGKNNTTNNNSTQHNNNGSHIPIPNNNNGSHIPIPTFDEEKEHVRKEFFKVVRLAELRLPIFLPGPTGCGKSHLAKQVAGYLKLPFGMISCSAGMSESAILGRRVPGKDGGFVYEESLFVHIYENGGVFLFDEMDAADPNVLLVINSALSNDYLALPARSEKPIAYKHPNFICIAAANTFGRGADRLYVGRNQLDEATLDRFRMGTVPLDYDERLEKVLCPDEELLRALHAIRDNITRAKIRRIVSTRFIADAYKARQAGFTITEIIGRLIESWTEDEVKIAFQGPFDFDELKRREKNQA